MLREVPLFMDLIPVHVFVTKEHLDRSWNNAAHMLMLLRLIPLGPVRVL